VALLARRRDRLEEVAKQVSAAGGEALVEVCDVTRDGEVEAAVARVLERAGAIDVVVANAGYGIVARAEKMTLEDYRRQLEVNFFGVVRTALATLEPLRRSRGSLVIVSSVLGHFGAAGSSAYAASKHALVGFGESLHHELRRDGVAVTVVSPGFVATEIRKVDNRGVFHPEWEDRRPRRMVVSAERAARAIVRATARRRALAVVTEHGKLAVFFKRHAPSAFAFFMRVGDRRGKLRTG
jgi:short-subunit dehydrogenase